MMSAWLHEIVTVARGVIVAVTPLVLLFLIFQVFLLRLPVSQVAEILKGTLIAAVGLFLFLFGVALAFLPFGRAVGAALGELDQTWLMAGIGALLGFVTAWGEPAVRVLADQVEDASNGAIPRRLSCIRFASASPCGSASGCCVSRTGSSCFIYSFRVTRSPSA